MCLLWLMSNNVLWMKYMYVFCSLFLVSHTDVIAFLFFVYVFELSEAQSTWGALKNCQMRNLTAFIRLTFLIFSQLWTFKTNFKFITIHHLCCVLSLYLTWFLLFMKMTVLILGLYYFLKCLVESISVWTDSPSATIKDTTTFLFFDNTNWEVG